jgi:hypothetical protein
MTNGEKIKLLEKWKKCHDQNEVVLDKLEPLFGRDYFEGELGTSIWQHFDLTTELVALALGDTAGWCSWYALENNFGRKAMEAGPTGKTRKIKSLADLLWLVKAPA